MFQAVSGTNGVVTMVGREFVEREPSTSPRLTGLLNQSVARISRRTPNRDLWARAQLRADYPPENEHTAARHVLRGRACSMLKFNTARNAEVLAGVPYERSTATNIGANAVDTAACRG